MLPWTVVYMTRPVLAALQTSHRCDSTRATIARGASVAHSCFISNPWIIGADLTFLSWVYVPPSHPSVSFALFPRFHAPSLPQTSPSNPFGSLMESCKLPNRARPATHCVSAFPLWIVSDATWLWVMQLGRGTTAASLVLYFMQDSTINVYYYHYFNALTIGTLS